MARTKEGETPPAYKHGLFSRWAFDGLEDEIEELSGLLIGSSPPEPEILVAARNLAEAVIQLKRVRAMKVAVLNEAGPKRQRVYSFPGVALVLSGDAYRLFAEDLSRRMDELAPKRKKGKQTSDNSADPERGAVLKLLARSGEMLNTLDEYERRALSRRATALRELDRVRIDRERRRIGAEDQRSYAT